MFIFLLFTSDGCRSVCQIFSHRLVAHLRRHRRNRAERRAQVEHEARKEATSTTTSTTTTTSTARDTASQRWKANIRTWIKCFGGSCTTTTPSSCTDAGTDGDRTATRRSLNESDMVRTLGKLLLKLVHHA